jgi:hypothetical protein
MLRKCILVLGKTGTGKSTLVKRLIEKSKRTVILDPLFEYNGTSVNSLEEMKALSFSSFNEFRLSFRSSEEEEVNAVFRISWSLGNVLLVVEESDMFLDGKNKYFNALVGQGRHRNVHLICIARRTPEVNKAFRAQATSFFSFYQSEPDDIEHLRQWGFDVEKINGLQRELTSPFIPEENRNYCVVEEKFDEIEFKRNESLTGKTFLES